MRRREGRNDRATAEAAPNARRRRAWSAFRRQQLAVAGSVIVGFFVVVAVLGPTDRALRPREADMCAAAFSRRAAHIWLGHG